MKEMKVSEAKKYLHGILKIKKKYVTCERLSKVIGVYPDVIALNLSYFVPTIMMDPDYNLLELVPVLKDYITSKEESKATKELNRNNFVSKKEVDRYENIADFIYQKYASAGGLMDRNAYLSDKDLKILKKLVTEEQNNRKTHKK